MTASCYRIENCYALVLYALIAAGRKAHYSNFYTSKAARLWLESDGQCWADEIGLGDWFSRWKCANYTPIPEPTCWLQVSPLLRAYPCPTI